MPTHFLFRLGVLFLAFAQPARSDVTLEHAGRAQRLLGSGTWSRIIAIEHDSARSVYPRAFHALVFELSGVLWFYTSVDGTQSFSLHRDNLAAEKSDLTPLVRAIEPGLVRWQVAPRRVGVTERGGTLPNGCFIDSVVALRERLARGEPLTNPRLLSYYVETPLGLRGHTVLAFEQAGGVRVYDAARPNWGLMLPVAQRDLAVLAQSAHGGRVEGVREWRLDAVTEARVAGVESDDSTPAQT